MNSPETTPIATTLPNTVPSIQERFAARMAKSNAMLALLTQQEIFLIPLSHAALITDGLPGLKQIKELRKKFFQAIKKKTPVDGVCDEVYALAQERMEMITASPRIKEKYTAHDLAAFRQAIDAYKVMP